MGRHSFALLGLGLVAFTLAFVIWAARDASLDFTGMLQLTLADVPAEDQAVYDMICKADTVGVFQIESRAQMSMLPRLKPEKF